MLASRAIGETPAACRDRHRSRVQLCPAAARRGRAAAQWGLLQRLGWLAFAAALCTVVGGHGGDQSVASGSGCLQALEGRDKGLAPVYGRCRRCGKTPRLRGPLAAHSCLVIKHATGGGAVPVVLRNSCRPAAQVQGKRRQCCAPRKAQRGHAATE